MNNKTDDDSRKQIEITGLSNRYQIKKLTTNREPNKERVIPKKWNLGSDQYDSIVQLNHLKNFIKRHKNVNQVVENEAIRLIISQIELKLYGYKNQDIMKKINNDEKLIKLDETINKLIESELKCFYCKNEVFILYQIVREKRQWTLDRINNDLGHFTDNVEISCLECNLKRRNQNSEKFLFTKQLNVVRNDFMV